MITRNVNTHTQDFRMNEIFNFNTGKIEQADYWLKQSPTVINKLKAAIQSNKKSYGCPFCKTPLVLKVGNKKHAHFSHLQREDGVDCMLCKNVAPQPIKIAQPKKEPVLHTWTSTSAYVGLPVFSSTATANTYAYEKVESSNFKASESVYAALNTPIKIEEEPRKEYASMSDSEVIKLIFEHKISRRLIALKNRVNDLILEGYNFPKNLIAILELRGSIKKMAANLSQVHYEKAIFES